jgi:hypothetical protein
MKVIVKSIVNGAGHTDTCHVAESGDLDLVGGQGWLTFYGYASKEAFSAGKSASPAVRVPLKFSDIVQTCGEFPSDLTVFEALWAALAYRMISDPASPYFGGTIEDADKPE